MTRNNTPIEIKGVPNPTAEARLRRLVAGCLIDPPFAAVRRIEREGLWEFVSAHGWQTRVGGILLHHLRRHEIDLPDSAARQLEAYRDHVLAANAYRVNRVEPVLARLQAEGIPFLVLKGAALNAVLYPEPGMRPMVDVDVLIRPDDAARAHAALTATGCTPGPDLVRDDFFPRYHYEREYLTSHPPPVKIDLHVRPFRPLRYARTVPDDALWDSPSTARFGDLDVWIPNAENMLIHLAVHAACHGLRELRWQYDIKCWIDRCGGDIDWERISDKCHQWRLTWPFRRALESVSELFDPLDPRIARALACARKSIGVFDRLALWQAPYGEARPVRDVLMNVLCTPGARLRLGYLRAVCLPGSGHLGQIYRRRHLGWRAAAHAVRLGRGLARAFTHPDPNPA